MCLGEGSEMRLYAKNKGCQQKFQKAVTDSNCDILIICDILKIKYDTIRNIFQTSCFMIPIFHKGSNRAFYHNHIIIEHLIHNQLKVVYDATHLEYMHHLCF